MRKKMYKAKKHWVIASATALAVLGTSGLVSADEVNSDTAQVASEEQTTPETVTPDGNQNVTNKEQAVEPTATSEQVTSSGKATDNSNSEQQASLAESSTVHSESAPVTATSQPVQEVSSSVQATAVTPNLVRASAATTVAKTSTTSDVTSATVSGKNLTLVYNRPVASDEVVKFAVWSDEHGQDDIVWYQADAKGAAYIDLSRHKNYGTYHVHTYSDIKGKLIGREAKDNVSVSPSQVATNFEQTTDGNILLTISNVGSDIASITVPVWSDNQGQDDIVWYRATQKDPKTYTVTINPARHHNDYGHYSVHIYGNSAITGGLTGLAVTSGFERKQEVVKYDVTASLTNEGIAIHLNTNDKGISRVRFAVWSDEHGQDDLKWYFADSNNSLVAPYKNHLGYGTYNIHTYADKDGKLTLLTTTALTIPAPAVSTTITKIDTYRYQITVTDVPGYITSVQVPVWSENNGQDDIKWYSTIKDSSGNYSVIVNVKQHQFENGRYIVHLYGYSSLEQGKLVGMAATSFTVSDIPPVKNEVVASLTDKGIALRLETNEQENLKNIRFAVWSDEHGQDDLKWYFADSNNSLVAPYKNHLGYGTYNIHTYADKDGKLTLLTTTALTIPAPAVSTTITKIDDYSYQVKLINVPAYVTSVKIPVWTDNKGQDDIVWYSADKNSDGAYVATILLKNHNFETGRYIVHLYGYNDLERGKLVGMGATEFSVDKAPQPESVRVEVRNHNAQQGILQVVLNETSHSKKTKKLSVAAWSEPNQANIHWYEADVVNGSAVVNVDERFHSYIKGDYTVHAYITYQDNSQSGFNLGQYSLQKERAIGYFADVSSWNGDISVESYRSLKNQGITGVVVKLTEGTNYINPYAARQIANAKAAGLRVSAYHFSRYTSEAGARAEAAYFVNAAKSFGLTSNTVMVNDMESDEMLTNVNANTAAWTAAMKSMGYDNLVYYTMASWLDTRGGRLSTGQLGMQNMWIAHYVNGYNDFSQEAAQQYSLYNNAAAWQYTSVSHKIGGNLDESIDYTGRFS